MTPERFREIVEAYGTVARRWPIAECTEAAVFMQNNTDAQAMLAREADLDRLLSTYRIASPDSALTGAIIASAPSLRRLSWALVFRVLGIAGAGLAGAVAGAAFAMVCAPSVPALVDSAPTVADEDSRPIFTSFDGNVGDFDLGETNE